MNRFLLAAAFTSFLGLSSLIAQPAHATGTRQYYGGWVSHPNAKYSYRAYYYKPTPTYVGYKHHYVIHHPSRPKHNYYYNPYTKKYWGRCPSSYGDKPVYSMLAEGDRNGDLTKIPEDKFPTPNPKLPAIPESSDSLPLDLPPDDLPDLSSLPAVAN